MLKQIRKIFHKYPFIYDISAKLFVNIYYRTERSLIKDNHKNQSDKKSIIHFTHNKSASMTVKRILVKIGKLNGMIPVYFGDYSFNSKFPHLSDLNEIEFKKYDHVLKSKGYIYSAFGNLVPYKDYQDFKLIYMIRDPRDVLVSTYYSRKNIHLVPPTTNNSSKKEFTIERNLLKNTDIDTFVINNYNEIKDSYDIYLNKLVKNNNNNLFITKYEDMIGNFEKWVRDLFDFIELEYSEELVNIIVKENNKNKPNTENKNKYLRKGISGDYLNKLKPETIELLNTEFEEILKYYNY